MIRFSESCDRSLQSFCGVAPVRLIHAPRLEEAQVRAAIDAHFELPADETRQCILILLGRNIQRGKRRLPSDSTGEPCYPESRVAHRGLQFTLQAYAIHQTKSLRRVHEGGSQLHLGCGFQPSGGANTLEPTIHFLAKVIWEKKLRLLANRTG